MVGRTATAMGKLSSVGFLTHMHHGSELGKDVSNRAIKLL